MEKKYHSLRLRTAGDAKGGAKFRKNKAFPCEAHLGFEVDPPIVLWSGVDKIAPTFTVLRLRLRSCRKKNFKYL